MGLQTHDGRDVRIQQAGRSYADVVQLSGPAVRECRPRQDALTDEPYTMHQVSQLDHSLSTPTLLYTLTTFNKVTLLQQTMEIHCKELVRWTNVIRDMSSLCIFPLVSTFSNSFSTF